MTLDQVAVTPLRRLALEAGDVLHAMKATDPGFSGFGEAYFSLINGGYVKGWKRHNRMTLNFVVPFGRVNVNIVQGDNDSCRSILLGPDDPQTHQRLTIPPGLWVAFGGVAVPQSVLLNLADLPHDPSESDNVPLATFRWTW